MPDEQKPVPASRFYVEFDSMSNMEFSKVSGLTMESKVQGQNKPLMSKKGGVQIRQIKAAGFEGLFTLELTTLMSGDEKSTSKTMYKWFQDCLPKGAKGKGNWDKSKKSGSIALYDPDGNEVMKWTITDAWPSEYKIADLNSGSNEYIEETYSIICANIKRTK